MHENFWKISDWSQSKLNLEFSLLFKTFCYQSRIFRIPLFVFQKREKNVKKKR